MLKIFKYLKKKEWLMILTAFALIVGTVWLDLKLPSYMSEITKLLQTGGAVKDILIQGLFMLLCALGSGALAVVVGFLVSRVASSFSARLRELVFSKVQGFSMAEINRFSTASLITRTTNDVTQIQNFVSRGLQVIIKAPVLAIWAITIILDKNWQWSVATASAVVLLMIMVAILIICVIPKFTKIQKQTDDLNKVTRENLNGVRVVRAYNAEKFEESKFSNTNTELTKTNLFTNRMLSLIGPFMSLLMSGLNLAIYWIGAFLISKTIITEKLSVFSDMVVFGAYAMQIIMAFIMLTMIFIILPRASVSAKRILEVLNTKNSIVEGNVENVNSDLTGTVEFKNVGFKYPDADEYVLKNISFKANQGETIAFIGSTGSGKSTLINLIPRIYDATEGEIFIDKINVKDYKFSELNNKVGYVSQKAFMFKESVKENITFGQCKNLKPTDEDVENALKIAQAKAFVNKLENGLEHNITQGGTNISGGQKQRLSIARAIARKPEILIFDDSFSALDYATDKKLRASLKKHTKQTTNLIVAQRIGTIKDADKIIVLENGEIVGMGKHKELMENCRVYKEIALSQLTLEELK